MKVSVVIPTYNERESIKKLLQEVSNSLKGKFKYEIIVVDDNSPDGTAEAVREVAKKTNAKLVSRNRKAGIGSAYKLGVEKSNGDVVVTMDADLSHDPKIIPRLVDEVERGFDLVLGSRYVEGGEIEKWNAYRRMVSKTANSVTKFILGLKTNDLTTGYRAYRRRALNAIGFQKLLSDGYSILVEAVFRAERKKLKIKEVPIVFYDRKGGSSKLGFGEQIKFLITVIRLRMGRYE